MARKSYLNKYLSAFLVLLMLSSSVLSASHVHAIEHHDDQNDLNHIEADGAHFDLDNSTVLASHLHCLDHHDNHDAESQHVQSGKEHFDNCLAYHVADYQQPVCIPSFDFGSVSITQNQRIYFSSTEPYQHRKPPARAPPFIA